MVRISNIFRVILAALLASLGFSCSQLGGYAEYGAPYASYKAKGVVVSEADASPIEGIRAALTEYPSDETYEMDTTYTNSKGVFSLKGSASPRPRILYVVLSHVDGEQNGSFERLVLEADYTDKKLTGGSGWYDGEAEIDLGTIKMKPE